MSMIALRLISRRLLFRSVKGLQIDDWTMAVLVTAAYTTMIVLANRWLKVQSNLEAPGFDFAALSPADIAKRVYGSKLVVVIEQMHIAVLWSCKACVLIMYHRITRTALHHENIAIKVVAVYSAIGYVVIEILYFTTWCRPFSQYYAVPTTSPQCITLVHHRITKAVFTISSDLAMLCIGIQMLVRSLLPMKRKVVLCAIFSLGLFVVATSISNSYYSFSDPYKGTWIYWYVRESSTAILVANLPFTWTILREIFELGQFDDSNPPPWTYHSTRTGGGRKITQLLHDQTGDTHSQTHSNASRATRSMTLVTSNVAKDSFQLPKTSKQYEDAMMDLADSPIELDDFAPVALRHTNDAVFSIDIERDAANGKCNAHSVSSGHTQQRGRPVSAPSTLVTHDETSGLYLSARPITPPSLAHLTVFSNRSSAHSTASLVRRPVSAGSSFHSSRVDGGTVSRVSTQTCAAGYKPEGGTSGKTILVA